MALLLSLWPERPSNLRALLTLRVHKLERVAAQWKVSKSEVLWRAIDLVASGQPAVSPRLQALDELQKPLKLTRQKAQSWEREVRRQRAKNSTRHEWRQTVIHLDTSFLIRAMVAGSHEETECSDFRGLLLASAAPMNL